MMNVTDNELRFLRKVNELNPSQNDLLKVPGFLKEDRQAFSSLEAKGLAQGMLGTTALHVRMTEDGKQALRDAAPASRYRRWLNDRAAHATDHLITLIIGGVIGGLIAMIFG